MRAVAADNFTSSTHMRNATSSYPLQIYDGPAVPLLLQYALGSTSGYKRHLLDREPRAGVPAPQVTTDVMNGMGLS